MAWTDHARPLLEGMPSRRRVLAEVAFVLVVTFAGDLPAPWAAAFALLVAGFAIVRPWRAAGTLARAGATLALVVTIVMPVVLAEAMHGAMVKSRRIGVAISAVQPGPDDPAVAGGVLEITKVEADGTAHGILLPGDRIATLDGVPLDRTTPSSDLISRLQKAGDDATLEVIRDHRLETMTVPVPRPHRDPAAWAAIGGFARDNILAGAVVRALCMVALVLLILRSDGQKNALGLYRHEAGIDLLLGLPFTFGAFATALVSGLLVMAITRAAHSSMVDREAMERPSLLLDLFGGTSLPAFAAAIAVTATFEEVVFRGFLLPRLRHVTGAWWLAVGIGAVAFGAGHVYEGWTAVVQTAALGVFFGVAFIFRGRLLPVVVAHASFDVTVFALLTWLQRSGLLDQARQMLEKK
jgi:membrane protease YdiL (CAAX protease family)